MTTLRDMRLRRHSGEAACLAIAHHRRFTLGTDDLAARRLASARGVPVIGTVGTLILGGRHGLGLAEANAYLGRMIALGYRSPVVRLDAHWRG